MSKNRKRRYAMRWFRYCDRVHALGAVEPRGFLGAYLRARGFKRVQ